jgi:hypothetical protein
LLEQPDVHKWESSLWLNRDSTPTDLFFLHNGRGCEIALHQIDTLQKPHVAKTWFQRPVSPYPGDEELHLGDSLVAETVAAASENA